MIIRFLADYLVIIVVIIGAGSLLWFVRDGRYQTYVRLLMMGLTALLIARLLALVYQPDEVRPFIEQGVAAKASYLNNPGFPSDHVLFVTVIAIMVWVATKRTGLYGLLLVLSAGVAIGRVLALVHTPLDVAGGMLVALLAGVIWYPKQLIRPKAK